MDERAMWEAVTARDGRADGAFVYAVSSTGVYCRPSCPSKRPRRDRVRFFASPEAAEEAGFRACLRCLPRDPLSPAAAAAERARAYLTAHAGERVTLATLAEEAGVSAGHLQRTFASAYGESPRRYQERLRVETMKRRLKEGARVSEAGYESGFGSSRGMNEGAARHLGMTPAAYRSGGAGLTIRYALGDAPVAAVVVGLTGRGICAVLLAGDEDAALGALAAEFPHATLVPALPEDTEQVRAAVDRVAGSATGPLSLDPIGTAFQRRVWAELEKVPAGTTATYGEIAQRIGAPSAQRAVASACGDNHIGVIIPCHRIVRADGGLGGYKWGLERKKQLLEREGARQGHEPRSE